MILKLGMLHWLLEYCQVCSNDDFWFNHDLFYSKVKIGPFCFSMGKCLSCRFPQETIEACKVKVGTYSQINEYMMIYDNPRSRWFIDTQIQHFQTSFPQKHLGRLKPNFRWSLHWILGWKFVQMLRVTWPRWLPYMIKTSKNLLQNQEADDIETWYTASGTQVLPNLFKWWHWVDLVHFYDMVKFVS